MKSRALGQMAALLTKPAAPKKPKRPRREQKPWRGGLADLAAYGRKGLTKMQEAKHG